MAINMGTLDRTARGIVGLILLVIPFMTGWAMFSTPWVVYASVFVGVVMLGTAAFGVCPMYSLLGVKTCKR